MVSVNVFPDKFKTLEFMIFTLLPVIPFTVVLKLFTELVLLTVPITKVVSLTPFVFEVIWLPDKFTVWVPIINEVSLCPFTDPVKILPLIEFEFELIIFAVFVASPSFEILAEITFPEVEKHLKFERLYCLNTRKD